jgi:26S proteasome regulatory subunit N4
MTADEKRLMDELIKERDFIEISLLQSIRELEEMGIGPNDSLVDSQGYPRGDIDLYRVRSLRSSISSTALFA